MKDMVGRRIGGISDALIEKQQKKLKIRVMGGE